LSSVIFDGNYFRIDSDSSFFHSNYRPQHTDYHQRSTQPTTQKRDLFEEEDWDNEIDYSKTHSPKKPAFAPSATTFRVISQSEPVKNDKNDEWLEDDVQAKPASFSRFQNTESHFTTSRDSNRFSSKLKMRFLICA
jgi:hypothetical protein